MLTADMIARDELLTSDMIWYAYQAAKAGKKPAEILGTHNKKQENYRSPQGFLLGWSADEAIAAAVYLFARHGDAIQEAIIEGVNTPGDSDSIVSLAGALVGAHSGKVFDTDSISLLENYEQLVGLANSVPVSH
jgi:ADP-ribosylglycohydrolase